MLTCNREFSLYLNDRLWLTGEHEHAEENELVGNEVRNFFLPHVKKKKKSFFICFILIISLVCSMKFYAVVVTVLIIIH